MNPEQYSVLHVIGATIAGGAERVAFNLARHLSQRGVRVGIFALSGRSDEVGSTMRETLSKSNVFFQAGPAGRVGIAALRDYARVLRNYSPDIVHLHTPNTELAHAIAGRNIRYQTARTIHNSYLNRNVVQRWAYRRNRVSLSIACSEAVALANRDWAQPVSVIANGVDFDWPIQDVGTKESARLRLGLRQDVRHYVMVGSMRGDSLESAQKAHDIVIRAWSEAALSHQQELHLVGDGPLRGHLEALALPSPTIHFHGISAHIADWLLAADVFVMPSRFEGLPLAGIEALGTGLLCIFSDIPPLKELNPENVEWCDANSVAGLVESFRKTASIIHLKQDFNNAVRFRNAYGMEVMADKYLHYYESILCD